MSLVPGMAGDIAGQNGKNEGNKGHLQGRPGK